MTFGNNIIGGKGGYLPWIGSDSHENTYLLKSQDPHSSRQYFQLNHSKFLLGWNTCLRLKLDDSNLPLLHFGCQQGRRAEPVRLALTCSRMQFREKVKISPAGEPNPALLTSTRNISSAGWFSKGQTIFLK